MSPERRRGLLAGAALAFCATTVALALLTSAAAAHPKVITVVPTQVRLSATRQADGSIVAKAEFTSPEPRCLSAKRFLQNTSKGQYLAAGGSLLFGSPPGTTGFAAAPERGLFSPKSKPGVSPYIWEATWPGSTEVLVTNLNSDKERHYASTVADATEVTLGAEARASKGQALPYFKVAYNEDGKRHIVKCQTLGKTESSAGIEL
jgi:hypothetical protein